MSGSSNKNKKKPVAGSFIPYETGYVNIAGETFFLSMGPSSDESFALTDDSLKTDTAFDLLFLGGTSNTFTDAEKATLQRVIRAIFGAGKSMTKKGLRLPCNKEEGELLIRSLLYRRSLLMDEIASYDELLAEDVHARYLRDHLDQLNKLIDEDVPQTIAPCKDTALVDPNKPAKVVGLDDDRMLKLLEIFAYLLAQGYDPVEVLGKKLPIPADILTRMAQKNAPLLRDYEGEFEREHGSGKRPPYTRTLIKIKKVLEDDASLLAAIAPEEALNALSAIEDQLKINKEHKGTIEERRVRIIEEIDKLQKALARALTEVQRLQAENDRLRQQVKDLTEELARANDRIRLLMEENDRLQQELAVITAQRDTLIREVAYWMSVRRQYEELLRDGIPAPLDQRALLADAIREIAYLTSIRNEYDMYVQQLLDQIDILVREIAYWKRVFDQYYEIIGTMFYLIDEIIPKIEYLEAYEITDLFLLRRYEQLVNRYGDELDHFIDENERLRRVVAELTEYKEYIQGDLLPVIWRGLRAFIERMGDDRFILPSAYPGLDSSSVDTLRISNNTLQRFLEGIQIRPVPPPPPPPPAAANRNGSMLCMLNTLYFILISQMDEAVEPILLQIYNQLQPDHVDLVVKVFYRLVLAIRRNLRNFPNPINGSFEAIGNILERVNGRLAELFPAHQERIISVLETFIGDDTFFKKNYSTGLQVISEEKDGINLSIYTLFLAILAGTLHANEGVLREFGCLVEGDLGEVVPPPVIPRYTLTLRINQDGEGIGTLTGDGPVNNGESKEISWTANGNGYTFDHWEPRDSVVDSRAAETNTRAIREDTTITAHLNEVQPPPPVIPRYTLTLRINQDGEG